jgi:hypothetical protein
MTDPVRPVAPREDDQFTFTRVQLEAIFSGGWRAAKDGYHPYRMAWSIMQNATMFDDLAAAPIPCTASLADLKLVLDAAQQYYEDNRVWANVVGPAYFNANLQRAKNRHDLGEAIQRLRKSGR